LNNTGTTVDRRNKPDDRFSGLLKTGTDLHQRARFSRAMVLYRRVLRAEPDHVKAHHLMSLALLGRKNAGDTEQAIRHLLHAVSLNDRSAALYNDLGNAYWNKNLVDDAMKAFLRAAELKPDFVQPRFNLGNCFWLLGRYQDALRAFSEVTMLDQNWAKAHYMIGNCLLYLDRAREAIEPYNAAVKLKDNFIDAYMGKAAALLKIGQWQEGWQCFQKREEHPKLSGFMQSRRPVWCGETLTDGTLLVYGEQGIGDVIQFIRFIPEARRRVKYLKLACDSRLHALFRGLRFIDELIDKDDCLADIDSIELDRRVLLMSLARIFDVTVDGVPNHIPYIHPDPVLVEKWRCRLDSNTFNVGLVWAGNPAQKDDHYRSCPLTALSALADISNTTLYSLQTDEARAQLGEVDAPPLIDLGDGLTDFNETAGLIAALDLLISVDTATAHLAGALGRPVWNLLWSAHCWRYLEDRDTTPWYPTMRLFRQTRMGDWQSVVSRVTEELARVAASASAMNR
jgi:tetratricopeptide (TPR) repeat protein